MMSTNRLYCASYVVKTDYETVCKRNNLIPRFSAVNTGVRCCTGVSPTDSCDVKALFKCPIRDRQGNMQNDNAELKIRSDVMEDDLPFLIRFSSHHNKNANLNLKYLDLCAFTEQSLMDSFASLSCRKDKFNPKNLRNLHNRLKHGTHTAMIDCIEAEGLWNDDLSETIDSVLYYCDRRTAVAQKTHPVVSTNIPVKTKQTYIACDIMYLEENTVFHRVDMV